MEHEDEKSPVFPKHHEIIFKIYKTGGNQFIECEARGIDKELEKLKIENPRTQRAIELSLYTSCPIITTILYDPWFRESYFETDSKEDGKTIIKKNEVILMHPSTILINGVKYNKR